MKKLLLLGISIFFLSANLAFSQEKQSELSANPLDTENPAISFPASSAEKTEKTENHDEIKKQINTLISKGLLKNKEEISSLSQNLTFDERSLLFERNKSNASKVMKDNFLEGFGKGSLSQGNIGAFLPHLIIEGLGITALSIGITAIPVLFLFDLGSNILDTPWDGWVNHFGKGYAICAIGAASGACVMIASRLISLIWPSPFAKKFNKSLKEALNLKSSVESISFLPCVITEKSLNPGLSLRFNFN